jgi:TatA/E family protein of Tat protein translocase
MFGLGMTEVVVILVIGLFLFGNRLPDMARWLGKSVTDFRHETGKLTEELNGAGKTIR